MSATIEHGIKNRPFLGERVSGDAGIVIERDNGLHVAIIDVLGHGPEAHEVAKHIVGRLEREDWTSICDLLSRLHESVRGGRGAAIAIADIDFGEGAMRYVGVGNTVVRKFGRTPARLVSSDGTLGHIMRTPREERLEFDRGDTILFYTDGVQDHFDLNQYEGFRSDSAWSIALNIVKLFGKPHDDATCIALKAV